MDVYTRGVWSEDTSVPDDYVFTNDVLKYEGYESHTTEDIGKPWLGAIRVYREDESEKACYPYFVNFSLIGWGIVVLVPDSISLLMLIKEVAPVIELQMKVEEHQWKAEALGHA